VTRASRFLIGLVTCFATHAAFPLGPRPSCCCATTTRSTTLGWRSRAPPGRASVVRRPLQPARQADRAIWAALETFLASSPAPHPPGPGRKRQIHALFLPTELGIQHGASWRSYNLRRPHRARNLRPPQPPPRPATFVDFDLVRLQRQEVLNGVINEYKRAA
jgi:hypothetical protein